MQQRRLVYDYEGGSIRSRINIQGSDINFLLMERTSLFMNDAGGGQVCACSQVFFNAFLVLDILTAGVL